MNILPLLGRQLKSDVIIDLLELWDTRVIYDFDRLHENLPDAYHASFTEAGIELHFDTEQILTTVFLHLSPESSSSSFDLGASDIRPFYSLEEAKRFASSEGLLMQEGSASFDGSSREWIRLEWDSHTVHYEFIGGALSMVTVSLVHASLG